jgi:hypothetical protein
VGPATRRPRGGAGAILTGSATGPGRTSRAPVDAQRDVQTIRAARSRAIASPS